MTWTDEKWLDTDGICTYCANDTNHENHCPVYHIEELERKLKEAEVKLKKFEEIVNNCRDFGHGRVTLSQLEKVLK